MLKLHGAALSNYYNMAKGAAAVGRLVEFSPWIAGSEFSYADPVGYFTFVLSAPSAQANADIDLPGTLPGAKKWFEAVGARDSVTPVLADQAAMHRPKK